MKRIFAAWCVAVAALVTLAMLATPAAAAADQRDRAQGPKAKAVGQKARNDQPRQGRKVRGTAGYVVDFDRDGHRRAIEVFVRRQGLPPGLAKRESLPPGLARQIRERGTLPPGLQKRLVPVPLVLVRELPPLPPYHARYFAGDDLLVIDTRRNLIVWVIPGVLRR